METNPQLAFLYVHSALIIETKTTATTITTSNSNNIFCWIKKKTEKKIRKKKKSRRIRGKKPTNKQQNSPLFNWIWFDDVLTLPPRPLPPGCSRFLSISLVSFSFSTARPPTLTPTHLPPPNYYLHSKMFIVANKRLLWSPNQIRNLNKAKQSKAKQQQNKYTKKK